MNIYTRKQRWKLFLLIAAILIGISSLFYTNKLAGELAGEERKRVELWAEAIKHISDINTEAGDISFAVSVLTNNTTVPMILFDGKTVVSFRNLDSLRALNEPDYLKIQMGLMRQSHEPLEISFGDNQKNYIYYKDSYLLTQLKFYPYIQLGVIGIFLFVSYFAFSSSRKAEQNQVWVGMAKETAHQLGTPLSSLMAWLEYLKTKPDPDKHLIEIEKDLIRLNTITERFSKIGSAPALQKESLMAVLQTSINYIKTRTSSKVIFELINQQNYDVEAPLNIPLFEWVLENVFKNAIDAMSGQGSITIKITDQQQFAYIDITDSGKGIPKSKYKTVFKPGYTSKSRGWGLGLSLSKRIVQEYHMGQIFVKSSEVNKGTTFRIVLRK
ncbi:MAG: HAMP domain-containing sensor histidine kinase [Bacteroidota bacterium]